MDPKYYATNLLSDVLGLGESSRLQHALKKETKLFTDVAAYITGSIDTGMFIITGKLAENITYEQAEKGIQQEIDKIKSAPVSDAELTRVKNTVEMDIATNNTGVMNKAEMLALAEMLESADLVNTEINRYLNVTTDEIFSVANEMLTAEKCSTLYYGKD